MQRHVESAGFSVVQQYVGHGIGRIMHENPQVPNFVSRELRRTDFRLEEGLVLAVEPMVNMGKAETDTLRDHWTVVTRDGLPSVHVEHTLALTKEGVYVVTADEELMVRHDDPGAAACAAAVLALRFDFAALYLGLGRGVLGGPGWIGSTGGSALE